MMIEIKTRQTESSLEPISANKSHNALLSTTNYSLPTTRNNISRWFVYILECQDGSFYTGVTNDLDKRMKIHAEGKGSKYVRQKRFRKLLRAKECSNRSDAQKAECQIKKLDKWNKLDWFN